MFCSTSTHFHCYLHLLTWSMTNENDGVATISLGILFHCLTTLAVKKFFLMFNLNLPSFSLKQLLLIVSVQALIKILYVSHEPLLYIESLQQNNHTSSTQILPWQVSLICSLGKSLQLCLLKGLCPQSCWKNSNPTILQTDKKHSPVPEHLKHMQKSQQSPWRLFCSDSPFPCKQYMLSSPSSHSDSVIW